MSKPTMKQGETQSIEYTHAFLLKDMSFNSSHMNQHKLQFNQFEINTNFFFLKIY